MLDKDKWGEIYNTENNYKELGYMLESHCPVIIGWTDEEMSHYDILLTYCPIKCGNLQHGLQFDDLFVSIIGFSSFGFCLDTTKHNSYIKEKLNLYDNITSDKICDLINGIIKYFSEVIKYAKNKR